MARREQTLLWEVKGTLLSTAVGQHLLRALVMAATSHLPSRQPVLNY